MPEQREFTRIHRDLTVVIDLPTRTITARSRDVSLRGALVICEEHLAVGTTCTCALVLNGGEEDIRIRAHATVVRPVPAGVALQFDELLDPESYDHLSRLVRYNAPDVEKVEREYEQHIGLKRAER